MSLSIIIVSYNTRDLLKKCLESVFSDLGHSEFITERERVTSAERKRSVDISESFPTLKLVQGDDKNNVEVFVVDNASTDGSAEIVRKKFPQVKLIQNKTNLGFAKANNQAIKKATGDYILLLNSDTEVQPSSIKKLIDFMDAHPQVGIVSAKLLNPDGTIQQSGGFIPRLSNIAAWMFFFDDLPIIKQIFWSYHQTNPGFYRKTRQLGWVQGAAMIIREKVLEELEEVGPLDEKIFMYGEDIDLCLRARKAGWQIWSVADSQVIHHRFQSGGEENALLGEITGLKYIFAKHKPAWELPILRFILKLGLLLRASLFATIWRDTSRYAIYKKALRLV